MSRRIKLIGVAASASAVLCVFFAYLWLNLPDGPEDLSLTVADLKSKAVVIEPMYNSRTATTSFRVTNNEVGIKELDPAKFDFFDTHGESGWCSREQWVPQVPDSLGLIDDPLPSPGAPMSIAGGTSAVIDMDCVFEVEPRGWVSYLYGQYEFATVAH